MSRNTSPIAMMMMGPAICETLIRSSLVKKVDRPADEMNPK